MTAQVTERRQEERRQLRMEGFESIETDRRVRHRRLGERRVFQLYLGARKADRRRFRWMFPQEWGGIEKDGVIQTKQTGWHYTEYECLSALDIWLPFWMDAETVADMRSALKDGGFDAGYAGKSWDNLPNALRARLWPVAESYVRELGYTPCARPDFQWLWEMLGAEEYQAVWDALTPAERQRVIDWSHSVPRFPGQAYRAWDRQLRVVRRELLDFACHWTCYIAFQHWKHGTTSAGEQLARTLLKARSDGRALTPAWPSPREIGTACVTSKNAEELSDLEIAEALYAARLNGEAP